MKPIHLYHVISFYLASSCRGAPLRLSSTVDRVEYFKSHSKSNSLVVLLEKSLYCLGCVVGSVCFCPKGLKNLRCTLCRSMYWFSFQLAIIVDRYYPHFIRYAPSTRITWEGGLQNPWSSEWWVILRTGFYILLPAMRRISPNFVVWESKYYYIIIIYTQSPLSDVLTTSLAITSWFRIQNVEMCST